ncbi:MAG: hypothetical protein Q4D27_01245 [Coriobacteriia bacterium]|nr:hypothetical protein [Coriobacteriia bacterium]
MEATFGRHNALAIIRFLRGSGDWRCDSSTKTNLISPNPWPQKRWTPSLLKGIASRYPGFAADGHVFIAVPDAAKRVRAKGMASTVYGHGIPERSFVMAEEGIAVSSPELLFVELAECMHPIEHVMLGLELCGTFSRDPADPYNGRISYGVAPATNVSRIRKFIDEAKGIRGIERARVSASFLSDNAWSPTEALIASLLRLPVDSLGYGLGPLKLNLRVMRSKDLPGSRSSRVPDILVDGTSIGINYDGLEHLDLMSIVQATMDVAENPESPNPSNELQKTILEVREKALDDIRRNRELASGGYFAFPVVMEDLYAKGGLDAVVGQILDAIENRDEGDMSVQRRHLAKRQLSDERYRMILSFLPGKHERNIEPARFIEGFKVSDDPGEVSSYFVSM